MRIILFLLIVFSFNFSLYAQQTSIVDFKKLKGNISLHPEKKSVKGKVSYTFKILKKSDSIYLDGKNMQVELLKNSPLKAELKSTDDKIWISHQFKSGKTYTLDFSYEVKNPKQALYFVGWKNNKNPQIWSQGQGKDNSYWLPSIDDLNDKIIFELTYEVPKNYRAIGNGVLKNHQTKENSEIWEYKMSKPMSSYLVGVAVGKFDFISLKSKSKIPIELYFEEKDSALVEPTYRYTQKIFDFLEKEIGVDYPWENYKQIPVRDFLYGGMENTTNTIFAETLLTDSIAFTDRNYVKTNAHELAHQWFGNLITEKSSADHWLQEGFATYYALLVEREIFGEDYFYHKLFESAEKLKEESDQGKGESLLNPKAGYSTFYEKGAWALHILKEKIGKENFNKGIKNYLEKYQFQNVSVEDFIKELEKSSKEDLTTFTEDWLKQSAFQAEQALNSLKKSDFIKTYIETIALRKLDFEDKYELLNQALDFPVNKYIGQEAVFQLEGKNLSKKHHKLYKKAFETNDVYIRQAIAKTLSKIPFELKSAYESLLKDESYLTQEIALANLWGNFPEERTKYLNYLKNTSGFYDKNIRILWLTLSLATPDYLNAEKQNFYQELAEYTSTTYDYSIRQNAFAHLYQINVFNEDIYKNLMQATTHPVWRFRKFSRDLLKELLKEKEHKNALQYLSSEFSEKQQQVLEKALKNK